MNARRKIGLAFLVIVMISPAISGSTLALGTSTGQNSNMEMPPPPQLVAWVTRTPTRRPMRTPTPTPKPTSRSVQVFDLNEIYYIGGSGAGEMCGTWEDVKGDYPAGTKLPIITADMLRQGLRYLCAYGFSPEVPATFELFAPNGGKVATLTQPPVDEASAQNGREIPLNVSYGLPYGTWTVSVRVGTQTARTTFVHPPEGRTIDVTHPLPSDVLHPLDPRWHTPFKQGDRAAVYGAGYAANSEVRVVIARWPETGESLLPVEGWNVRTNSLGHLYLQFTIDSSYPDGYYAVFARPNTGKPEQASDWIRKGFTVYSPWHPCKGAPLSNLHVGDAARLTAGPPNNVRNHPRLGGNRIGQIQVYQIVHVKEGPKCNDGMVWWYVEVYDSLWNKLNLEGWTAEGDDSGYWLLPVE